MPRNPAGVYSLPAGNPVITGTVISSTVHNATMTDIAAELTDSLARDGGGAMTGALQLPDGTGAAPALTFSAETSSGLYRAGSNDLRLQINTANVLQATGASITIPVGLTVTQDTANGSAVTATGNGTGYGADFSGGSSNGTAVRGTGVGSGGGGTFTGGATGVGVTGTGGATSGTGVVGTGTAGNAVGVAGTGQGSGNGVRGTGGATDGTGVRGFGGATNGRGVWATGSGSGIGVVGDGGTSSGTGVSGQGGTPNGIGGLFTGVGTGVAVQVHTGHASFTGGNPAATTGFTNTLTPKNLVKAWGLVTLSGAVATLQDGFNIASVTRGAGIDVDVTFATAMASATFAVVASGAYVAGSSTTPVAVHAHAQTSSTVTFHGVRISGGGSAIAPLDPSVDVYGIAFVVFAQQ